MRNDGDPFETKQNNFGGNEAPWNAAPSRDLRNIGNKIISTPENTQNPELGQIVDLEMPSGMPNLASKQESAVSVERGTSKDPIEAAIEVAPYEKEVLKTTNNKLDRRAIKVVDKAIDEFVKNGDAAGLYETGCDMREAHLDNSYNRKIGEAA